MQLHSPGTRRLCDFHEVTHQEQDVHVPSPFPITGEAYHLFVSLFALIKQLNHIKYSVVLGLFCYMCINHHFTE